MGPWFSVGSQIVGIIPLEEIGHIFDSARCGFQKSGCETDTDDPGKDHLWHVTWGFPFYTRFVDRESKKEAK